MGNKSSIVGASYTQVASWLTYPEWKYLRDRAATRQRNTPTAPAPRDFIPALTESKLKKPVKRALAVMHDHATRDGHVSLSKTHLANLLGTSERTVQRHWAAAVEAGYLTKHDYPADSKRVSDMWLWPGTAPRDPYDWDQYLDEPMQTSTGPAPF